METYQTTSSFNKEDFIRIQKLKWKILWKKNSRILIFFSLVTAIIILNEFINNLEGKQDEISSIIASIALFLTLWLFLFRYLKKMKYYRNIERIADDFEQRKMECTYEFSDESVKYWDNEKSFVFKWNLFTYYSIYENFLILRINDSVIDTFIFERKDDDYTDYDKIIEFAKAKLEYKKI